MLRVSHTTLTFVCELNGVLSYLFLIFRADLGKENDKIRCIHARAMEKIIIELLAILP